jgi:hypothetical protein
MNLIIFIGGDIEIERWVKEEIRWRLVKWEGRSHNGGGCYQDWRWLND